jgi:hypothetical protein
VDLGAILRQVGDPGHEASEGERVFRQFTKGEISRQEYNRWNAVYVGENVWAYPPLVFPLMSQALQSYVTGRASGAREWEPEFAAANGQWLGTVRWSLGENASHIGLLIWAKEHCQEVSLTKLVDKIDQALDRFHKVRTPDVLQSSIITQRKDAADKRRGQ